MASDSTPRRGERTYSQFVLAFANRISRSCVGSSQERGDFNCRVAKVAQNVARKMKKREEDAKNKSPICILPLWLYPL